MLEQMGQHLKSLHGPPNPLILTVGIVYVPQLGAEIRLFKNFEKFQQFALIKNKSSVSKTQHFLKRKVTESSDCSSRRNVSTCAYKTKKNLSAEYESLNLQKSVCKHNVYYDIRNSTKMSIMSTCSSDRTTCPIERKKKTRPFDL